MRDSRRHLVWHQGALHNTSHPTALRLRSKPLCEIPQSSAKPTSKNGRARK